MTVRRATTIALIATLLVGAAGASGCASLRKAFTPKPKVVSREATVAAPAVEVAGTIAKGLPEDVPLWPGARVVESTATKESYALTLDTSDGYDAVLAGLVAGFEDGGWSVVKDDAGAQGARSAVLSVSGGSAEGVVTVAENADAVVEIVYVLGASK